MEKKKRRKDDDDEASATETEDEGDDDSSRKRKRRGTGDQEKTPKKPKKKPGDEGEFANRFLVWNEGKFVKYPKKLGVSLYLNFRFVVAVVIKAHLVGRVLLGGGGSEKL